MQNQSDINLLDNSKVNFQADIDAISRIPAVENILEVICSSTGMGFAAVARVTKERWITCAVRDNINFGLRPGDELEVETTICFEIESSKKLVVINNVAQDEHFSMHHTPKIYGFQSYISVPIILKDDRFFGTLCAIDPSPAKLDTPEVITMFKLYADMIAFHLNTLEQLSVVETSLKEEKQTSDFRDQFIAVLGHDLRNPVGAIRNCVQLLLQREALTARQMKLVQIIQDGSFRISGLIENVLDFARGRLGDGITLNRSAEPIENYLLQVIEELQMIWPNRVIDYKFSIEQAINCDNKRIAQLFSNLLGNALTYGAPETPVVITATSANDIFKLSVQNAGNKIPEAKIRKLFKPFHRGESGHNKQGLGLGLYIASQIAKAHEGTINVTSNDEQTCFSLVLPCKINN